ncbi:toll/interleukin-1 receptor domain-containing protein [Bradyrhizobium japonicum]|uniref:toll/interleukin-1 receptor domain-containing protein n=1 Tax=Bradyrhizobium japonicum TaxID=375 RepID=UPI001BADE5F3|nr:TIR domain-containing protein [Bradyrhizobium japonicum]MBR0911485.1 TIR domain-containing protein [Bradyrhizobium japonicum]
MSEALRITAKTEGSAPPEIVFLCHNSQDKPFIRGIADALELEFGTKFFLDIFAIPTGEQFIPWIEKALEECAVCAIFLGANGWGPTHLWEAELALARYRRDPRLRIIPVALPGIDLKEAAKLGSGTLFQEVNWADFTKGPDDKESLDKLEAALSGRRTLGYRGPARLTPYQLRRDAERWEKSKRKDSSILYGGRQLVEAERMARENADAVVLVEINAFLAASRERQSTFWRRLALGAGAALFLVAGASVVAAINYFLAEERRLGSASRQLAMATREGAGADRVMLIGARAVLVDGTPEANGALLEQLQDFRFLRRVVHVGSYVEAAALGRDGGFLVSSASMTSVISRDGATPRSFQGSADAAGATAIAQGEDGIWLGFDDGRVDVLVGAARRTLLAASSDVPEGGDRKVRSLAYDASKKLLAVGTGAGRIAVVNVTDGVTVYDDNEGDSIRINSLSFDPTRPRLAIGTSEGTILLMDTRTKQIDLRYPRIGGGVLALGYTTDGSLAAVGGEGRLFYFDRRNPELESPTTGDAVPLATAAAVDPATARVAVGDSSGVVRLFDATSGRGTGAEPLRGHSDTVTAIVFGRTRDDLISASSNGTVAVWDLAGNQGPSDELPQSNPSPTLIRSDAKGALVAATAGEDRAEVRTLENDGWKTSLDLLAKTRESGEAREFFPEAAPDGKGFVELVSPVPAVALSDDAARVAWSTSGGAVLAMPTADRNAKPSIVMPPGKTPPQDICISGDGRTLATIEEGGVRVSVKGLEPATDKGTVTPPSPGRSIALSPDGALLAVGMTDGAIAQYSAAAGWSLLGEVWKVNNSEVAGLAYSSDGKLLVSYGSGGGGTDRAVTFSSASGKPDPRRMQSRQAAGSVSSVSVGTYGGVAVGDQDGQVLRWSVSGNRFGYTGRLTAGTAYVTAVLVDDSRKRLVTASGDGSIRSWPLDTARWIALACAKANRDWRADEWRELLPDDPYVASCSADHPLPPALRWWRMLLGFLQ